MQNNDDAPPSTPPAGRPATPLPPPKPRRRWLGALLALLFVGGLAGLAWTLTHPSADDGGGGPGGSPGAARGASGASRAGSGAGGFGGGPGRRGGPPPTTVNFAVVGTADIPITVDALGTVTPSATITVRPQVSGVLTKVLFTEGQVVKAGQPLAVIDPRPFDLAVMQAKGQLMRDQAQLENAKLTLGRYRTLLAEDSIARQDVDTQAALVRQYEGVVMTDQAAVGSAQLNVAYTRITAPVGGRIGLRNVDVGNLVSSSDTGGVATITELAPIDVEFALPQDRIPALQARIAANAELPVTALDRTRSQVLDTGRFLSLNNQSDTTTGTVKAKARFANAQHALFPSQFVNVRLLLDTMKGALVVPVTALRHGPDGDFVWILGADRTVTQRAVKVGPSTPERTAIASGLAAGERVITEGGDRLKDGARVVLPGDAASGAAGAYGGGRGGHRGASGASAPWAASAGASGASWGGGHHHRASDAGGASGQ